MDLFYQILFYLGIVMLFTGIIFIIISGLGILRMPDTFTRIHAGTKASTLGSFLVILGIGFIHPEWLPKLVFLASFILITNPISSSILSKSAYKSKALFINKSGIDMYKDINEELDKEEDSSAESCNNIKEEN